MLKLEGFALILGLAWGLSYHLSKYLLHQYKIPFPHFSGFFLGLFSVSWMGAKVFFLGTLPQLEAISLMKMGTFWMGGGLVFYGGLFFGLAYLLAYNLVGKRFPMYFYSFLVPPLCFAQALGRVGCLISGCCYGKPTHLPWAVFLHGQFRHPVQLYEGMALLMLGGICLVFLKNQKTWGWPLPFYLLGYGVVRFYLEFFRGDFQRKIFPDGYSFSQHGSALIIGLVLLGAVIAWVGNLRKG